MIIIIIATAQRVDYLDPQQKLRERVGKQQLHKKCGLFLNYFRKHNNNICISTWQWQLTLIYRKG